MKILVVEDDELNAYALTAVLTDQNYAVEVATDGDAAWDLIETYDYDLILLDVMLPKLDGISLCRQIRSSGRQVPILLLTGCDRSHEKATGLDAGADDYVVKPFDQEELVARVRALLRRGSVTLAPILEWGNLQLDPSSCEVTYAQNLISLTPKEYALLELFLRNQRRVFSCGMILEHLWSYEDTPGEEAVRTHIKGLRMKLKSANAPHDLIETVYGIGYRLKPQKEENKEASSQSQQQTLTAIANIWQRFRGRVDEQLSVLEQAAQTLTPELLSQASPEAHTLAGSLGTFGLPLGSELARKIEKLLKSGKTFTKTDIKHLQNWVKLLRQEIESHNEKNVPPPSTNNQLPWLLVIENDANLAEQIKIEAINWGLNVSIATNLNAAKSQFYRQPPNVVLLDPKVGASQEDSGKFLAEVCQYKPPIPVLVFTDQTNFSDSYGALRYRLQIARNGKHTFLQKPMPPQQILAAVQQALENSPHAEPKILVVDDDPQILALLQTLLTPWGLKIIPLSNPRQFWPTLETQKPDLLILDVEMPYINGIELCQVVRNDPQHHELPILFLTVHNDAEIINQIFSAGADDFVSKPIIEPELVTRIINRLERVRLSRQMTQNHNTQIGDITQQKHTEIEIQRINRTLQTLTACNQALVRAKNESDLLQQICHTIVEVGGYRLAWVGFALQDIAQSILPVAQAGYDAGYLQSLDLTWADAIRGQGPTATAIRTGQTSIIQNILTDPNYQIWQGQANERGYASSIALPLIADNQQPFGALNIYATSTEAFDTDEVKLLQELAADLAYGIVALRNQQQRQLAELALHKIHDELELRVAERTAELITANYKLQLELDERQRTQDALIISQTRFEGILSIADDAIISIDGNQCITLFNQGAEKIFGYYAQEILGKRLDLLLPMRFSEQHRHHVTDFGKSPSPARRMGERREIFGRHKDGTEFPAEASISKLDVGSECVYTVILRDITERKQVERMKDEFVSVVSHELRTPLTSIHGSLGMLASGLLPTDSEQGKRLLEIATDSTERLVRLINDILDIERIESGKVKMERENCNLDELISSALNIMQPLANKAGVNLSISSLSVQLWADPDRIVQTLTNLLSNAIKFSTSSSTVWLTAKQQKTEVLLIVKDTGRGIPSDKLDSIFERFQQVDSSDSRNHEGTGLGLAISKSIVQQHGGKIWAESVLNEGSTFYLTLPIWQLPQTELENSASEEMLINNQYSPLVLVCDDDVVIRTELKTLLEQGGYLVMTVATGEEAISTAITQHPDVILLDLLLPGMNGWETMAVLKAREDTQNIPIVICSVYQPSTNNQPSANFVDWLSKPVEEISLLHSLKKVVAEPARKVKILIVEDDNDLVDLLATLFERHDDIETFFAKTGKEAIHLSQKVNPDLLILDLILPESDGFTVVDWLKQHNQLCTISVVVYSAKDLDDSERHRLKLGHTEFLTKGRVSTHEVEQRVLYLLQKITGGIGNR
ncbi:response regulator [Anabaena sp. WFMT]|uniref:response regulator n=1 Tax=Anabaena sp. WFMT TaxID=3449730 RepID=UPI003F22122A